MNKNRKVRNRIITGVSALIGFGAPFGIMYGVDATKTVETSHLFSENQLYNTLAMLGVSFGTTGLTTAGAYYGTRKIAGTIDNSFYQKADIHELLVEGGKRQIVSKEDIAIEKQKAIDLQKEANRRAFKLRQDKKTTKILAKKNKI